MRCYYLNIAHDEATPLSWLETGRRHDFPCDLLGLLH
jgi:hypothetical protein